jgi:hypothetical protein
MPSLSRRKGFAGDDQCTMQGSSTAGAASNAAVAAASGGQPTTGIRRARRHVAAERPSQRPAAPPLRPAAPLAGPPAQPRWSGVCLFAACRRLLEQPAAELACGATMPSAGWTAVLASCTHPCRAVAAVGTLQTQSKPNAGAGQRRVAHTGAGHAGPSATRKISLHLPALRCGGGCCTI